MIVCQIDGIRPLTANERNRGGWATHHTREREMADLAWADARKRRGRKPRVPGPVVVTLVVTPPDRRRRDVDGWGPTLKRCLDGVVRAGVLRDDSSDVVTEVRIRCKPKGDAWRIELHIDADLWSAGI